MSDNVLCRIPFGMLGTLAELFVSCIIERMCFLRRRLRLHANDSDEHEPEATSKQQFLRHASTMASIASDDPVWLSDRR